MIHDPHQATLTVVCEVTHPAFVLLDPGEQERRATSWGRVLATVCRSGRIATLQVLERTLPDSGTGLAEWWAAHGTPTRRGPQTPTPNSSTAPDPLANDTPPHCHSVST